jgi:transcriptional regulator with XRE-family HTH domain
VKLPRLRATRERRALSQRELADLAGVSRTTIVSLEQGADSPFPSTVRKLARALGVEPHELMEPEPAPGQQMALAAV